MPFTLTHVVAIVPFKKIPVLSRLSFSALAIGSMIPDAPIFFSFASSYQVTHSVAGLFTACLPLGVLFYILFQALIRKPLLEIMPAAISGKLGSHKVHSFGYCAGVMLAIVIGAATHVFWDSFTHPGGWGTQMVPALAYSYEIFGYRFGGYRLMQHGSSVVFLPLMAWLLLRWASRRDTGMPGQELHLSPLLKTILFILVFAAPAFYALIEAWLDTHSVFYGIGHAARNYGTYLAITSCSAAIAISGWMQLQRRKRLI